MRAILPAGVWVVLTVSGVGAVAAQKLDADSIQVATRVKVHALLNTYGPAKDTKWHESQNDPYTMVGYYDKDLRYTREFEIYITITNKATIWVRVYPLFGHRIELDRVNDPNGMMRKLLRDSYHNFFFWGVNDDSELFAGFEFTLESGFPEEAMKVVIRSIPNIDSSVGELVNFIE